MRNEFVVIEILKYLMHDRCLEGKVEGKLSKVANLLDEYLDYNVIGSDYYGIVHESFKPLYSNLEIEFTTFIDRDNTNPYSLTVIGNPGEVHYSLKEPTRLRDCMNNGYNVISFGLKTGEDYYFMKNYINDPYLVREEYRPNKVINADVYNIRMFDHYNDSKLNRIYEEMENTIVNNKSSFTYPNYCSEKYLFENISVYQQEDGIYLVEVRDCDSRVLDKEVREGESLYSVYYDYMIEKGYFNKDQKYNVK